MSRRITKWVLFAALTATVPSLLFLVQVVLLVPSVYFLGGTVIVLGKAFTGSTSESLAFATLLSVHFVLYAGIFFGVAAGLAAILARVPSEPIRFTAILLILCGLTALTFLPVYGGGGHGPMTWGPIHTVIGTEYGDLALLITYGPLAAAAYVLFRSRPRSNVASR